MSVNVTTLSWDLVIIVFFVIVMAYSFIIGKHQSIRVIVATYIAVIATQGIANIFLRLSGEPLGMMQVMDVTFNITVLAALKIFLFAFFIIVLSIRSGIHVAYSRDSGSIMNILYTALFGFATAGLIIATIVTYVSGNSILDSSMTASGALLPVMETSPLMQIMVFNVDLWFAFPALLIALAGFIHNE